MMRASCSTMTRRALPCLLLGLVMGCAGIQQRPVPAPSPEEIPELESELERRPDDAGLLVRLGAAYREADSLEKARTLLEKARRIGGEPASAVFYLGLTYEDLEQFGEARAVYQAYLERPGPSRLEDAIRKRLDYLHWRELKAAAREAVGREEELADRPPGQGTVAVFPFLYQGQDEELRPLSRALAAFLVTDLGQIGRVTVLERLRVQLLLDEMELAESRYVDPSTAARSGRMLGAANIVQGRLGGDERELSVEASVVDVTVGAEGGLEQVLSDRRAAEEIFEVESRIVLEVFRSLGVELTPAEWGRIVKHPTEDLQAFLAYGRGLMAGDSADFATAARHFQEAARLDPNFEEARERAQQASELSRAAATPTDQLARSATEAREGTPGTEVPEILSGEPIAPGTGERDPVAEATGAEGTEPLVRIRIRIPTPGGGG